MRHARRVRARWLTGAALVAGVAGLICWVPVRAEETPLRSSIPASYERKVTTMDEACDVRKKLSSDPRGLKAGNSKAMQGPKAPYAEGSFSSAAYREKTSSELRRRQEQAFADFRGTNAAASNVAASNAVAKVPQQEAKVPPAGKAPPAGKNPAVAKVAGKPKAQ